MEAEEEAREVATASAALFGGTEGEPRFDDDDGMDGSDLPPSFAMPMLPRGDEEEDAAAPSSVPREEAEKQMEDANLQPQETMADTTEAHVTQTDGQQPETTTDTDDSAMEAADRRCYQCRFENCPKFAQGGGLCIAHGGGYRCQTPFCAFFNLRTCPDHGGSKRCGVTGCTRVAQGTSALCCAHGGGRKCSVKKCDKYDAGLGLCLAHGGGRDCTMNDCTKKAIRYGLCSGHGGRARCKVEGCEKYDRGQGKCKAHGGGYFCKVQGCNKKDKGGDDAKLKAVAIGLSMEVDASNTAAQGSVALVVGATNTTKEVDTALHTVVALHVPSRTAPRNRSALDDAVRMVGNLGVPWRDASVSARPVDCARLTEARSLAAFRIARARQIAEATVFVTVVEVAARLRAASRRTAAVATARLTEASPCDDGYLKDPPYLCMRAGFSY
ncbi:hypothetical protein PC113_g4387 [Phytophthora cactorum]|uniref:WRKY19-like zinc finger domain-containing protein n=1 Tax=Phytophthora cactorum TaxID=29920 RepID=A0A8T0ZNA6_9STRA|nr:hypothetical protein PC113_g4387 [Phytophthora cactorum]